MERDPKLEAYYDALEQTNGLDGTKNIYTKLEALDKAEQNEKKDSNKEKRPGLNLDQVCELLNGSLTDSDSLRVAYAGNIVTFYFFSEDKENLEHIAGVLVNSGFKNTRIKNYELVLTSQFKIGDIPIAEAKYNWFVN